jgi:hypothetical protein
VAVGDSRRMSDVLRFWHAVEMFDPHDIPNEPKTLRRKRGTRCIQRISLKEGEPIPPLPWQSGHRRVAEQPEGGKYGSVWRHTVYGGVFSFRAVRAAFAEEFGYSEQEDYAGAHKEADSALFAVTVDEHGVLLDGTGAFSSCAWATGRLDRLRRGDRDALDGFDQVAAECERAMARLLSQPIPYPSLLPRRPAGTSTTDTVASPGKSSPAADSPGRGWLVTVTDTLGAAVGGAVAAAIGAMAPVLGGVVGAGAVAGAAGSVMARIAQRVEQAETKPALSGAAQSASVSPQAELSHTAPNDAPSSDSDGVDAPAFDRRSLQVLDVVAFAAVVADILQLPTGMCDLLELRVVSYPVGRKHDLSLPDPEPVFLSSLTAPDLQRVADEAASGFGSALASYLSDPLPEDRRIDVRLEWNRDRILGGVRPFMFPLARWPADSGKPLAVSQQFAVNTIVKELADGGLFAVNGPPGTGKTTLLRDLIAAIVVQRAKVLAELSCPRDAFTPRSRWVSPTGKELAVRGPRDDLSGFEIVVASSNNTAVENVTKELPLLSAIGKEWQARGDYFAAQARSFLGLPAWGMLAVPLGKSENRKRFRDWFWKEGSGLDAHLMALRRANPPETQWDAAKDRFSKALQAAEVLAAERAAADKALHEPASEAELQAAVQAEGDTARVLERAEARYRQVAAGVGGLEHSAAIVRNLHSGHERACPGGLGGTLGIGRQMDTWRRRKAELEGQLADLNRQLSVARDEEVSARRDQEAARLHADRAERVASEFRSRREDDKQRLQNARDAWGTAFPEGWQEKSQEEQECSAPWSDEKWIGARTEVFLAALDLHRALVVGAAGTFRFNVRQLCKALTRDPDGPPPDAERAAWQTMFLLAPVVSTTFASCGRMLAHLGRESIGWLLIDEAGQALPQDAVGALWRARRAVVVGDPRQLEPISQVPAEFQERLRWPFEVDLRWLPAGSSAQTLADQQNKWGTFVPGDEEGVWVGAPLRVHRRCEKPMFDISNAIAYGGLMVYGTDEVPFPGAPYRDYPRSCWVDVSGVSEGKWVPAQGDVLLKILRRMHGEFEISLEHIYILSPFRDVVSGCKGFVEPELRQDGVPEAKVSDFIENHIATVHKMQGKEARVVVFVLGTDPSRAKKARDWAARSVNLLNVAVSRAQRRLFVIGDFAEWQGEHYFRVFDDPNLFPRRPLPR